MAQSITVTLTSYLFLPQTGALTENIIAYSFGLSFIINYPHFAYSYQLLYDKIHHKLTDKTQPRFYRLKLFNAAVVIPALLIGLLGYCYINHELMPYMYTVMMFTVGWHYVKQGYGMLIVLSAKQNYFFNSQEKSLLLLHTYLAWMLNWCFVNKIEPIHGIHIKTFVWPKVIVILVIAGFILSFVLMVIEIIKRLIIHKRLPPLNGMVGYFTTVYLWNLTLFLHPVFIAFIPALHSLQYTMCVVKYKKTEMSAVTHDHPDMIGKLFNPFTNFFLIAIALGAAGFFFLPYTLDYFIPLNSKIYGSSFFTFCFIIFINTHHYFIDNVIWRKENQNVKTYL